jgi:hypothetical protein
MFGMSDASEFAILIVLLPMVPAILIFLVFPKTDMVAQGPLQGLSIRAGGAFGAYLVVLLVLIGWMSSSDIFKATRSWRVMADVVIKNKEGRVVDARALDKDALSVSYVPASHETYLQRNKFRIYVTATEINGAIPTMTITYSGVGNATLNLDDLDDGVKVSRDDIRNRYKVLTPLVIEPFISEGFPGTAQDFEPLSNTGEN